MDARAYPSDPTDAEVGELTRRGFEVYRAIGMVQAGDAGRAADRHAADRRLTRRGARQILKGMPNYSATLDGVFHALSDPTRRAMVERLGRGPASVSELAAPLVMSLPAVVQHLQVLEATGLVRSEKVGRVRTCHVEPDALRGAERWIAERRTAWERRLDRLGAYLAEHPDDPEQRRSP